MYNCVSPLLFICAVTNTCAGLISDDDYYDDEDYEILGRSCTSSEGCGPLHKYCCVLQGTQYTVGYCNKRPNKIGQKCSNMLYRSGSTNNMYAPYLYSCPCVQPRLVCHRTTPNRDIFGVCQHYTNARPGG